MLYEVGPNRKYREISELPFGNFANNDAIQLEGRPTPYAGSLLLSKHGMHLVGVAGADGSLPHIKFDGVNLYGPEMKPYHKTVFTTPENFPTVIVGWDKTYRWGFPTKDVVIRDVVIDGGGNGLYLWATENVLVQNVTVQNAEQGIFASGGAPNNNVIIQDVTVSNCGRFRVAGQHEKHGIYTEALHILFDHVRVINPTGSGNALKDRSLGTIIRYCDLWGGAMGADLVNAQERRAELCYRDDWGTALIEHTHLVQDGPRAGSVLMHFGGEDTGYPERNKIEFRKQLTVKDLTVSVKRDAKMNNYVVLARMESSGQHATVDGLNANIAPFTAGLPASRFCAIQREGNISLANVTSNVQLTDRVGAGGGVVARAN